MKPFLAPSLLLAVAAALAAQDAPAPPGNPPAPIADVVARALQGVDPARIERTVRALVGFGTRHVLSRTDSDTEGTGAARKWLRGEYEAIAQASGGRSRPIRLTRSIMRAAPTSASRRRDIGVGPACASCPFTVTSNQRWPCEPVTTPIVVPSASRIGPCSICASK